MKIIEDKSKVVQWMNSPLYYAQEADYGLTGIKILPFICYILTDKRFRRELFHTINYAFMHAEFYRGMGASDVIVFLHNKHFNEVFIKEKSE